MTVTAVIQIGNTDDKLSQAQWSGFVGSVRRWLQRNSEQIHFDGSSPGDMPWQNACFVAEFKSRALIRKIRNQLRHEAMDYGQDSIALTIGRTEFIRPRPAQVPSSIREQWLALEMYGRLRNQQAQRPIEDWQYSTWTIDCFSQIHDQATLFNRNDPVTRNQAGVVGP